MLTTLLSTVGLNHEREGHALATSCATNVHSWLPWQSVWLLIGIKLIGNIMYSSLVAPLLKGFLMNTHTEQGTSRISANACSISVYRVQLKTAPILCRG